MPHQHHQHHAYIYPHFSLHNHQPIVKACPKAMGDLANGITTYHDLGSIPLLFFTSFLLPLTYDLILLLVHQFLSFFYNNNKYDNKRINANKNTPFSAPSGSK
jgi:hypothetical protein